MIRTRSSLLLLVLALSLSSLVGCRKARIAEEKDYSRMLPPGQSALRKITDPAQLPDLQIAYQHKDASLDEALSRSQAWFAKPSTRQFYPFENFNHEQAQASVFAFRQLLGSAGSASEFQRRVREEFDTYISVGWNMQGGVLYTGYYTPIFPASRTQTGEYRYPLYKRPADLASDPITGKTLGRRVGAVVQPYPTRAQIESSRMLAGTELVWMRDKLDAYIVQVNGSARLTMTDGSTMYIGYAGNNGYDYSSIGRMLVADGKIPKNRLNLAAIRGYFHQNPQDLDQYLNRNDRFVFFQEYNPAAWPAGSLGEKVTPYRTLATDKAIFPRGGVTLVKTSMPAGVPAPDQPTQWQRFDQFMCDQDTGGAIRAPGRADIYMGIGQQAEALAGRQFAEGWLYYLILKPERVQTWAAQMKAATPAQPAM